MGKTIKLWPNGCFTHDCNWRPHVLVRWADGRVVAMCNRHRGRQEVVAKIVWTEKAKKMRVGK